MPQKQLVLPTLTIEAEMDMSGDIPDAGATTTGDRVFTGELGPWYPYPYYYAPPPVIIQQQPPVYVQPQQPEDTYWYYCPDPQGYYPYIRECPGGWMKVVPQTTPPQQ